MKTRRAGHVVALTICSVMLCARNGEGQSIPATVTGAAVVKAETSAGSATPPAVSGERNIGASAHGTESNPCANDAKQSVSEASAVVTFGNYSQGALPFVISASARALGGIGANCPNCSAPCAAISDVRTQANGRVTVTVTLLITFSAEAGSETFGITVEGKQTTSPRTSLYAFQLLDADGNQLGGASKLGNRPIWIEGKPGSTARLVFEAEVSTTDEGGCCEERGAMLIDAQVVVRPAPILAAQQGTEFVMGGKETNEFKEVGAILADDQMHCTGTLITRRIVLTAAHCVDRWLPSQLKFITGATTRPNDVVVRTVENLAYPQGELGFRFSRALKRDDVALLFLKDPVTDVDPVRLYDGNPEILKCCLRTPPTFVGFGYGDENRNPSGQGVKRFALIDLKDWNTKEFTVADERMQVNTCKGDSGGPAFFIDQKKQRRVLGVVSWGDAKCKEFGVNMRVDGYQQWLQQWVR